MCYVLLLSTSSDADLAQYNNNLVQFCRDLPKIAEAESLKYGYKWHLDSKSGCSCTFRHLCSIELGFGVPVDWYPEEVDSISATIQVLAFISDFVGVLAYLGLFNAEVIFWTNKPIESNEGKIAWILISIVALIVSSIFATRAYRRQSRS